MDFETFYNKRIPDHCPISPFTSCVAVYLYLDIEQKIRNLASVDNRDRGRHLPPRFTFIIPDKDRAPIQGVNDIYRVSIKKPFLELHYMKATDIEMKH